jgi:hypothetical protein
MAPILTPEDVVRRIAAECTFVDERGAVGFDWNRPPRSYGSSGSNFVRRGVSGGPGRRNRRLCSDWPVVSWGSF